MTMGITATSSARRWIVLAGIVLAAGAARAQQDQAPRFRSGVDVTSVDVTVVDERGKPILGLTPEDFTVRLDGNPRRVISADWVPLTAPEGPKPPPPPEGYSSNEGGTGGRLILLVVDQPNIRFGGFVGIRKAVNGFLDRLQATDRVALVGIGPGAISVPFTNDRERLRKAVEKTTGQRQTMMRGFFTIAISEAMSIRRGDGMTLRRVQLRECGDPTTAPPREVQRIEMCFQSVEAEVHAVAASSSFDGEQTMSTFRDLLGAMRSVNAPNTLVLITEGFVLDDQHPNFSTINDLAAAARTSIYVLKLDDEMFEMSEARAPEPTSKFDDRMEKSIGVELLASSTRGSLFNVVNSADYAFERIEAEISGQYLLGVESNPLDKDGKPHSIGVSVNRRGVTVRSRRQLTMRPDDNRQRTARETVMAGLAGPLPLSALPLRVATFALQGQGRDGKIQLLIHADIGVNYTTTRSLSLGYMFTDKDGRIVESQTASARLRPMLEGVPSPLRFTGGASLPPGDYTLKMAVVDGDLAGSLEHPVQATLMEAGAISLSELMVGGPVDSSEIRPTIGHTVSFGNLQAYIEAYGAIKDLKVRYEIATSPEGDAILAADVPPRGAGDERAIYNRTLPVRQLPPGSYVLRAVLTSEAGLSRSPLNLTRSFEIAPPAVLMTSADSAAPAGPSATELFLPVGDEVFDRPFDRTAVARPATLNTFRSRVADGYTAAFDKGVAALEAGDYPGAETSFKSAITPSEDSTAALAYLAATFAAAGHDLQAASAWQTSLIDGAEIPEIYQWLGDTLLRVHDLPHARAILEEAVGKWPTDPRFAKPLAMLYATMGLGREAVRTMQRHLEAQPADVDGLFMGVEWIYNLHTLGTVARSRAEDLKLARTYASAYERAKGPQGALVKQWIDFLDPPARRK
jgi:VWFA-related protein